MCEIFIFVFLLFLSVCVAYLVAHLHIYSSHSISYPHSFVNIHICIYVFIVCFICVHNWFEGLRHYSENFPTVINLFLYIILFICEFSNLLFFITILCVVFSFSIFFNFNRTFSYVHRFIQEGKYNIIVNIHILYHRVATYPNRIILSKVLLNVFKQREYKKS